MWIIDPDKRFSYTQASDAVKKTDTLLISVIETWSSTLFRQAVLGKDTDWLEKVRPDLRSSALTLMAAYSEVVARYAQVQSIIQDTWKIYFMTRKYPWHGTTVGKSDHFHFLWLSFTHHCYLFEERVKRFYSAWRELRHLSKLSEVEGGDHIKVLTKRLNEYIKHRGVHTHQWNVIHKSYSTYQILAHLAEHDDEYQNQASSHYYETKQGIMAHIASGVGMMAEEFFGLKGNPHLKLKELVPVLNRSIFEPT